MSAVSKMVASRIAISRTVLSSLQVHGPEVAQELTEVLFPEGAPAHLTVEIVVQAMHDALARSVDTMSKADIAHAQELADDEAPRAERDQAIADTREQIIAARGVLSSVYGEGILSAYDLAGETAENAYLLVQGALTTVGLLRSRPIVEKARQPGVIVDRFALADAIEGPAKRLEGALVDVRREEREAQLTQKERNVAVEDWSPTYQGIADTATGLYEIVRRKDLADVVRPTARRRAGLTEDADVPTPEPTPEPG
jgi:hypothetical protein